MALEVEDGVGNQLPDAEERGLGEGAHSSMSNDAPRARRGRFALAQFYLFEGRPKVRRESLSR